MPRFVWIVCRAYIFTVLSLQVLAQTTQIDLREWGYKSSGDAGTKFQTLLSSQLISVARSGETVVGFVTRNRMGLATRERPPLSLHVLRFASNGTLLSQGTVPTPSWNENAIIYGNNGTLLIRAGPKLGVFSLAMEPLASEELPPTRDSVRVNWKIFPFPDRTSFLLYHFRGTDSSISLLNWSSLRLTKECAYSSRDRVLSISNKNILTLHSSRSEYPLRRVVEVSEMCGPSHFFYSWEGGTTNAILVDDNSLLVAGGSSWVNFVVDGRVQWADAFDKKSDVVHDRVEVDMNSQILAIAVKKLAGGSSFFDRSGRLKSIRVIVYQAHSGRRELEVSVEPTPSSDFDFALSPEGNILAILSDGFVKLITLSDKTFPK